MVRIVIEHGLVPVPVDIEIDDLTCHSMDLIKAATTEKTKAIIFCQVFGLEGDVTPYYDFLESKGIEVIEDRAQAFRGTHHHLGFSRTTLTLLSFGIIKTHTSIKGGVAIIRGHKLFDEMRDNSN